MKFDIGQEVICVDNLDMERVLTVGDLYKVAKFISPCGIFRTPIVMIEGNEMNLFAGRFMDPRHPAILEVAKLYHEISELDSDIEESYNIEYQSGDDLFWQREKLRGKIDTIKTTIETLRAGK